ncbi:MAG: cytochrome c biogenesis protein CcsA [Alphaproteobacteria bacterium]|nr:cytochrome c biogenesis protein CcsA [Alphaproteobacteria bacterium]
MANPTLISIASVIALIPVTMAAFRIHAKRDLQFWLLIAVAVCGPAVWLSMQIAAGWQTGFSAALWVTIAVCLLVFACLALISRDAWRLAPLLMPYLLVLAVIATIWNQAPAKPMPPNAPPVWVILHIVASVVTYAMLTLAAIAGTAVVLQERALRQKRRGGLVERLPSVADAEILELRLLMAAEAVLGIGMASGMAMQFFTTGDLLILSHKTILIIVAFAVIAVLLVCHFYSGLRGRRAARYVLLGYLLVTLGYPGVKFVTDVILA